MADQDQEGFLLTELVRAGRHLLHRSNLACPGLEAVLPAVDPAVERLPATP